MKRFKHSGTLGDIIYSLAVVRHLGGGEFYLHLDQINWIVKHYYGGTPLPFHQGRMTPEDFKFMQSFMLAQDYITDFAVMDPAKTEITHNLDQFRTLFVGHPGNYVDIYAETFGIRDPEQQKQLRQTPWLSVAEPKVIEGRNYVINRTGRWNDPQSRDSWISILDQAGDQALFVGLPNEWQDFQAWTGRTLAYQPTKDLLALAEIIAGAEQFIGNQSVALSLAIGLGVNTACEARKDLPRERNECWFPDQPNVEYF